MQASGLSFSYGATPVLRDVTLHLYAGEGQSGFLFDHLTRNRQRGGRQRCRRLSDVSIIRCEARDWLSRDVQLTQLR